MNDKKRIKILSTGILPVIGFINGPILTPYYESVQTIYQMVLKGIEIVEVLPDGTEVKLTHANVMTDNTKKQEKKVSKQSKVKDPVVEEVKENPVEDIPTVVVTEDPVKDTATDEKTTDQPTVEEVKEDVVEEKTAEPEIKNQHMTNDEVPKHYKNKKNKYNR